MKATIRIRDPEAVLMRRVRQDQPGAFAELVRLYQGRIFGFFLRTLLDRQEAEDLTQDVFLRLYRSRKRYRCRARVTTWIFFIAQNVLRNALRSRRRRAFLKLGGHVYPEKSAPSASGSLPDHPLERSETAQVIRRAIGTLQDRQRKALEMLQFQDRSYAEIADSLDLTLNATKSLLYRARVQLREILQSVVEFH